VSAPGGAAAVVATGIERAPGQPYERLADHVGEVAVKAWRGNAERYFGGDARS
jgi:hypothetical protein